MEIVPAILPKNYFDLEEKLSMIRGLSKSVQIDVCDGRLTPRASWPYVRSRGNKTLQGDEKFSAITDESSGLPFWEDFNFEIDLMVSDPATVLDHWVSAGAERVVIHRTSISPKAFEQLCDKFSGLVLVGMAVGADSADDNLDSLIGKIGFIQVMGIQRVGFQGEPFDERAVYKVAALRKKYPDIKISVDGGVSLQNAGRLIDSGADRLVVGSALFESHNIVETMKQFKRL